MCEAPFLTGAFAAWVDVEEPTMAAPANVEALAVRNPRREISMVIISKVVSDWLWATSFE
jgi:hypothetical protein